MNKSNAKDYLPYVQALADQKTVQVQNSGGRWQKFDKLREVRNPTWSSNYPIIHVREVL